jgi:hypothetical protein
VLAIFAPNAAAGLYLVIALVTVARASAIRRRRPEASQAVWVGPQCGPSRWRAPSRLADRGLVERGPHAVDRRLVVVTLTEATLLLARLAQIDQRRTR